MDSDREKWRHWWGSNTQIYKTKLIFSSEVYNSFIFIYFQCAVERYNVCIDLEKIITKKKC